jgi:formyltetrahydrofolate deformylase
MALLDDTVKSHVLLIDGPDQKGLIYKITGCIFDQGLNIVSNSEFVDPESSWFFMRSEFTGDDGTGLLEKLRETLPPTFTLVLNNPAKKNIVVMVTKEHHCLADLLVRNEFGKMNATIQAVISNHDNLQDLVDKFHVPFHHVPVTDKSREDHEAEILAIIDQYQPDYIVLAKYMRILTSDFVNRFVNRLINIHHSFLPAFIGVDPYEQAFHRGVKIIGATAHFVTEQLDEGAIIDQEVIQIDHKYTVDDMRQAGQDVEVITLAKALKCVFEDRVFIKNNKTIIFK